MLNHDIYDSEMTFEDLKDNLQGNINVEGEFKE